MKTIIAIMGSPRKKGDTYGIVSMMERELKDRTQVDFRYVHLKERNLEFCRGCLICMKRGEDACPVKDGAAELRRELLGADGIIFASPVYVHQVTAMMKNFFDRFVYFIHRPAFHGKPAVLVTSTEISGNNETLSYLRFCAEAWGLTPVDSIGVVAAGMKMENPYKETIKKHIRDAAEKMLIAMENGLYPRPIMRSLRFFNKMKTKVIIHRDMLPYDYLYWRDKGWLTKNYFYDVKIPFHMRVVAKAPVLFIIIAMKLKLGSELFNSIFSEPMRSYGILRQRERSHENG